MRCVVTTRLSLKCKRQRGKKLQMILLLPLGRDGVEGGFCRLDVTDLSCHGRRGAQSLPLPGSPRAALMPPPSPILPGRRVLGRACSSGRWGVLGHTRLFSGGEDFQRSLWDSGTHCLPWVSGTPAPLKSSP